MEKWRPWLADRARELVGLDLQPDQLDRLEVYVAELLRWNARINLTAITEPSAVAELHLLDSLAIVPHVPEGASVLDVGSGAGLPGIPLAIVRADVSVRMVDRTEKKVLFLRSAIARLGLRAVAVHERVEAGRAAEGGPFDVAVSRAFAEPSTWLQVARPQVRPGGRMLVMLGAERPPGVADGPGGDRLVEELSYALPSGARRGLWVVERAPAN